MSFWAVAQTETKREGTADQWLRQVGFETYLPMIRAGAVRPVPLFPNYLFVRIADRWRSIENTIGVIRVLTSGERPSRLADTVIEKIRARECDGIVVLPKARKGLSVGDPVQVIRGSFEGMIGIYAGMATHDRQRVLLDLLGRQVHVELAARDLRLVKLAEF